jgi:putative transposase
VEKENKSELARRLGVSRALLYYRHKQPVKDWKLKCKIEKLLRKYPSYGHKRIAIHLKINKKRALRAMKIYGIKPYRRRTKKYRKTKPKDECFFKNLLLDNFPEKKNRIWVSDFTYLSFKGRWIYLATIMDLYDREIAGISVLTVHSIQLTMNALLSALNRHPHPKIIHSDHGSEYTGGDYVKLCSDLGIKQSMSKKGSPWENGYQESFYSQFKIDLGDPNRFYSLGELVYNIYMTIYKYNNLRIHTSLKMAPTAFAMQHSKS